MRRIKVAAAQLGPIHRHTERKETVTRILHLLDDAAKQGATMVLFPELAFTTFFPRHLLSPEELDSFFLHGDLAEEPSLQAVINHAKVLQLDVCIGFAEHTTGNQYFNSCVYASNGRIVSKYRKVHLPGTFEPYSAPDAVHHLEKRYFTPGDLGFKAFAAQEAVVGMMVCNDRRWPEAWRVLALQGTEVVLCGYNTAGYAPDLWGSSKGQTVAEAAKEAMFHHKLVMQANSYMNATWSVCAARCGWDDDKYMMIQGSMIISPQGVIVAESATMGDEVVVADIDLHACEQGKTKTFDFARHRRTEAYGLITSQTGVVNVQ